MRDLEALLLRQAERIDDLEGRLALMSRAAMYRVIRAPEFEPDPA